MKDDSKKSDVPFLTKEEVIFRIEMMIKHCTKPDTVVSLKNALSYVKRLKE